MHSQNTIKGDKQCLSAITSISKLGLLINVRIGSLGEQILTSMDSPLQNPQVREWPLNVENFSLHTCILHASPMTFYICLIETFFWSGMSEPFHEVFLLIT